MPMSSNGQTETDDDDNGKTGATIHNLHGQYDTCGRQVSERKGLPDLVIWTMYRPTTPREVTVVDGAQLIIASPPAR
ncbi:hypothetical protein RR48_14231 [Papilio machaon]|uniref:Uncharacterized protein n=1 Tax=Papilio machaon TaxID=76193 RepID=A0A194QLT9_PAPMA|nr:hypothetical protein RR48_14231 [Papilio machaon]